VPTQGVFRSPSLPDVVAPQVDDELLADCRFSNASDNICVLSVTSLFVCSSTSDIRLEEKLITTNGKDRLQVQIKRMTMM